MRFATSPDIFERRGGFGGLGCWAGLLGWAAGLAGRAVGLGCWVVLLGWGAGLGCWAWLLAWAVGRVFGPGCGLSSGQGLRPWQAVGPPGCTAGLMGWAVGLACCPGLLHLGCCVWRLAGFLGLAVGWAMSGA